MALIITPRPIPPIKPVKNLKLLLLSLKPIYLTKIKKMEDTSRVEAEHMNRLTYTVGLYYFIQ